MAPGSQGWLQARWAGAKFWSAITLEPGVTGDFSLLWLSAGLLGHVLKCFWWKVLVNDKPPFWWKSHWMNHFYVHSMKSCFNEKLLWWKATLMKSRSSLPLAASKAFTEVHGYLCLEPTMDYPQKHRWYNLIMSSHQDKDPEPRGLSTIMTQTNDWGKHSVIAYASQKLQKHKKIFTSFLLRLQATIWGMEHYAPYLKGWPFTLFTDH